MEAFVVLVALFIVICLLALTIGLFSLISRLGETSRHIEELNKRLAELLAREGKLPSAAAVHADDEALQEWLTTPGRHRRRRTQLPQAIAAPDAAPAATGAEAPAPTLTSKPTAIDKEILATQDSTKEGLPLAELQAPAKLRAETAEETVAASSASPDEAIPKPTAAAATIAEPEPLVQPTIAATTEPIAAPAAAPEAIVQPISDDTVAVPEPAVSEPPPPPREPSAMALRLLALRNWLLYGNAAGNQPGAAVEKMLATTWLLRVGILVILCTSVFLLKLSIERGLLAPEGRVALSYLLGAVVLWSGLRKRLRERYWALGQALAGIGLGVFYFSSYAMVGMYGLVPPIAGGAVMVLTAVTAGLLANSLASLPIAMVSMLGGYATPLLLNTGAKNFSGLAGYLLLLGTGILWLANRRNWQQLTWLAMLFSYGLFALAYNAHFTPADFDIYQLSLILLFILFSTSIFIYNIRQKIAATGLEIFGLLSNAGLFFLLSRLAILQLHDSDSLAMAPLPLGLAFFYLLHAIYLKKRGLLAVDRTLLLIFCALSGFFLALTPPVLLSRQWLSAAWALEGLTMLWLAYKLESKLLRSCAWLLYLVSLGDMLRNEFFIYGNPVDVSLVGCLDRCLQFITPVACLALGAKLTMLSAKPAPAAASCDGCKQPQEDTAAAPHPCSFVHLTAGIFLTIAFTVAFIFLLIEVHMDLKHALPACHLAGVNIICFAALLGAIALLIRKIPGWWKEMLYLVAFGLFLKLLFDMLTPSCWNCCLNALFQWSLYCGKLFNTIVTIAGICYATRLLNRDGKLRKLAYACNILWPVLLFLHSTREVHIIVTHKLPGLSGGGISILWSIFAFAFIYNGLRKASHILRYIGLGLFTIVVLKVFLMDLSHLDALYRVLAFLVFGCLLMGAAFIYLKLWRNKDDAPEQP